MKIKDTTLSLAFCIMLSLLLMPCAKASRIATIQGKEYKIDTLRHVKIGPGTLCTSLLYTAIDGSKKFRSFIITSDMKGNDNVEYRMEIGNDSILTGETISHCAQRKTAGDEYYFAGVNADFYITWQPYVGIPNMACYQNGKVATNDRDETIRYGHFFMDYDKNMWCDFPVSRFSFKSGNGAPIYFSRINMELKDNELVLFNEKNGNYTHTASGATEVPVMIADGHKWGVNEPFKVVVTGAPSTAGNMRIVKDGAVLSALGSRESDISALNVGDTLTMDFTTRLGDYSVAPRLKEVSGGDVVILKAGTVIYEADRWINARDSNNPRTMFGYNQDRSKMIWCVVDGRSMTSDGCTYPEGADVMALAGSYDAVNVDGGGSAQMYVRQMGMVNVPSDGTERAVSNGFYAVLKAPADSTISEIRFVDYAMKLPKYGVYTPKFYGYNKYGLLLDTDVKGVRLACDAALGTVSADGSRIVTDGGGTHALTATYNGYSTSIAVTVDENAAMNLRLDSVLIDNYRAYQVEVNASVNESVMNIDSGAFSWSSDNSAIVAVSADGILRGVDNGTTVIHGVKGDYEGSMKVTVEKPVSRVQEIDPEMNVATWATIQSGGKGLALMKEGDGMKITYTGASSRSNYIKLTKKIVLWSLPDTLRVRINPLNAPVKSIAFSVSCANASGSKTITMPGVIAANADNIIDLPASAIGDAADISLYPITLNSITVNMNASTSGTAYSLLIPNIETVYALVPASTGIEDAVASRRQAAIYPNPVMRGAAVTISNPGGSAISIYTIAGQLVQSQPIPADASSATLNTSRLERGIYILTSGNSFTKLIIK